MRGHKGWTPLPDGALVRHYGQQYWQAQNGTGRVVRHFWNGPWLEYVVEPLPGVPLDYFGTEGLGYWSADAVVTCEPLEVQS